MQKKFARYKTLMLSLNLGGQELQQEATGGAPELQEALRNMNHLLDRSLCGTRGVGGQSAHYPRTLSGERSVKHVYKTSMERLTLYLDQCHMNLHLPTTGNLHLCRSSTRWSTLNCYGWPMQRADATL